jgi:hypothetical protein
VQSGGEALQVVEKSTLSPSFLIMPKTELSVFVGKALPNVKMFSLCPFVSPPQKLR